MILVLILITLVFIVLTDQNIYKVIQTQFVNIISTIKSYYYNKMPLRAYDHVNQFKDYGFPLGFILKNIALVVWKNNILTLTRQTIGCIQLRMDSVKMTQALLAWKIG